MRRLVSILLLGMSIIGHSAAQPTLPDWLPDEPLRRVGYSFDTPRVTWMDDETLIFETEEESYYPFATFQYEVASGELTLLETMPLRLDMTPELTEHYQSPPDEPIYRLPFTDAVFIPIIYRSRLSIYCGHECGGGLIMLGTYTEAPDVPSPGSYKPLADINAQCGIQVNWSKAATAVIHSELCYGYGWNLYHLRVESGSRGYNLPLPIGGIYDFEQHLLAISEDGNRALYDSFTSESEPFNESLYYWQTSEPTESNRLPTIDRKIELSARNANPYPFAAANFIRDDDDHILAVHTDGIVRINLDSDTRELLNPEINADWIRLGYFSPDNRYLALVTWDSELYVIETDI